MMVVVHVRRIIEEITEIHESIDRLKAKLRESENALEDLLSTRSSLSEDMTSRKKTIFTYRQECMKLRLKFPILSPHVG